MKKIIVIGFLALAVGMVFFIGMAAIWQNTAGIQRLLFIAAISSTLIGLFAITMFVPTVVGVLGLGAAANVNMTGATGADGKKPIIFQVPKNHRWILRNVWRSDPVRLTGYEEKKEGWRFYIPTIWQADEGLVNLAPRQLDPNAHTINCVDGNDVRVDVRATYCVRADEGATIKFLLNTADGDTDNIVIQRLKVAINQAMNVSSEEAIGWDSDKKKEYGERASTIINELLKDDRGKDYGLEATISIENIEPTPEVKAAADRNTAEEFDKKAMKKETDAITDMITRTHANPTAVMVGQLLSDAIREIFGQRKGGKKNE